MMMRRKNIHYNIYSDWAGFGMVRVYCAFSIAHLQNGMRWIRQEMGKWNEKSRQMSSMKYSIQWRWFDWTQIQLEQASKRAGRQASIHDMHRTCRNIVRSFVCLLMMLLLLLFEMFCDLSLILCIYIESVSTHWHQYLDIYIENIIQFWWNILKRLFTWK